jgi:hypothetical protein
LTAAGDPDEDPAMGLDADSVARELRDREPIFHRVEQGTSRAAFEVMTVPDYWEVGASGTVYTRQDCLDELERRYADAAYDPLAGLKVDDFAVREAGPGAWLATYRLHQGDRQTRRVSVWRRAPDGWVLVYHQGTLIG